MEVERELMVLNQAGIHLRVASKIVKLLSRFNCAAEFYFNGRQADAKSIMSLTQLMAPKGSLMKVKTIGPDALRAAQELDKLFKEKFGEE